jgi:hypothetical protein
MSSWAFRKTMLDTADTESPPLRAAVGLPPM